MLEQYDFKLIKSGRYIEVYEYRNKKIFKGYKKVKNEELKNEKNKQEEKLNQIMELAGLSKQADIYQYKNEIEQEKEDQKQKAESSVSRTRRSIKRLTNANPQLNKFLTLTFAKSTTDLSKANYLFNQAIKRIVRSLPDFEYIAVVEFQKDIDYFGRKKEHGGSVHYHLLCNINAKSRGLPYIFGWERLFAKRYWKNGFVKVKDIEQIENMGAYFCKYLSKDMFDKRMFNKKKFFCSQTLNKPVELTGNEAKYFFERYVYPTEPVFQKRFSGEYSGIVDYSAYLLKEDSCDLNIEAFKGGN